MPRTTTKSKTKKTAAKKCESHGVRPSIGIIITLSVALLIAIVISVFSITALRNANSTLASDKLAVFDHLISDYVSDLEVNVDKPSVNEVTGYGVSDEDGVFYVTFDFATYTLDGNQMPQYDGLRHGILYFWPDKERGTYSHAFSYHDDYYHPGGTYVEIGDHNLRTQLGSGE